MENETFEKKLDFIECCEKISDKYNITEEHAGCYLSNYNDRFYCDGCKNSGKCMIIRECENKSKNIVGGLK